MLLAVVCAVVLVVFSHAGAVAAEPADAAPPAFFDPLITVAPGITREVALLFDHTRDGDDRRTQASIRLQYPVLPWLHVLKPVRGTDELRPQTSVLPGIEFFLPWQLILSIGVQLPLGPARFFDQRVLGFLKRPF